MFGSVVDAGRFRRRGVELARNDSMRHPRVALRLALLLGLIGVAPRHLLQKIAIAIADFWPVGKLGVAIAAALFFAEC